jgi:hypothetical protein
MAAIQWGRKETIIFPPHNPIYSYGAVFLALEQGIFVLKRRCSNEKSVALRFGRWR